jgi:hypothetical protein
MAQDEDDKPAPEEVKTKEELFAKEEAETAI